MCRGKKHALYRGEGCKIDKTEASMDIRGGERARHPVKLRISSIGTHRKKREKKNRGRKEKNPME